MTRPATDPGPEVRGMSTHRLLIAIHNEFKDYRGPRGKTFSRHFFEVIGMGLVADIFRETLKAEQAMRQENASLAASNADLSRQLEDVMSRPPALPATPADGPAAVVTPKGRQVVLDVDDLAAIDERADALGLPVSP